MTIRLIVARHGNTFNADETPRRIGARTDLPLTDKGKEQGRRLGAWLRDNAMVPDAVYTSRLIRTRETAEAALTEMDIRRAIQQSDLFDEIDHGPDENKTDPEIVARLGVEAFAKWEQGNIMPREWSPKPEVLSKRWQDFAAYCEKTHPDQTVLVVTSNGVARFAPQIAGNGADVVTIKNRKMSTGALSIFEGSGGLWMIAHWNVKP
ncbi:MAG: histidine phosphatase family protein [Rhodospirillales bacterium]|nr:histidine phosphatase family protein [Alphaproteobacteria bacterium]MCB9987091.1 histidine phosphatase family protein [Rhodospirillales bacterium]USO08148.1 MAG: histidine phosphatase family protein [Rhodospirillales bacterium]